MRTIKNICAVLLIALSGHAYAEDAVLNYYFNKLKTIERDVTIRDEAEKTRLLEEGYGNFVDQMQKKVPLVSANDLHGLFMSARLLDLYATYFDANENKRYFSDMQMDFAELQRRGIATDREYLDIYQGLITRRDFDRAANFGAKYKFAGAFDIPKINRDLNFNADRPGALYLNKDNELDLKQVELQFAMQIIVVANCHFASDAARDVSANPAVRAAFKRGNAIWLSPSDGTNELFKVREWNRRFPRIPLAIAFSNSAWRGIDFSESPTFYFYKNGHLVRTERGWRRDGEIPKEVIEGLTVIDAL